MNSIVNGFVFDNWQCDSIAGDCDIFILFLLGVGATVYVN